jgi:hypothetical protein
MVFLFTPAAASDSVRNNVDLALSGRKYEGRVYSVVVGPSYTAGKDVPWILLKLPHRQVESAKGFAKVVKEIAAQCAGFEKSSSHA